MCVTNTIRDDVIFYNDIGWQTIKLTNTEIEQMLEKQKENGFLNFAWGVWVTAYARYNLLSNVIKLDEYCVYCDTDSIKLKEGFDKKVIEHYNKKVIEKIKKVSNDLKIDIEKFMPKDKNGKKHIIGIFENDGIYHKFITQGAKKYAYISKEDYKIYITVAGVPKKGRKALKKLEDFKDDFIFEFKDTGKNLLIYNDEMEEFNLEDYNGKKQIVKEKYACVLIPTTYVLGKSLEYSNLLNDNYSDRAIYKE